MNELVFAFNDSINLYSLIHFVEYSILSLIPFVNFIHVALISVSWEILEVFIPQGWAKENIPNKFFDIIFNFSGFYSGRVLFKYFKSKYYSDNTEINDDTKMSNEVAQAMANKIIKEAEQHRRNQEEEE